MNINKDVYQDSSYPDMNKLLKLVFEKEDEEEDDDN